MGRLAGKTAIVTGAGQGIGEAIARAFAREDAAVLVAEMNAETGKRVVEDINGDGGRAEFVETDVTDREAVQAMVQRAAQRFGSVDVLVNNAGINVFHEPHKMPRSEWARCMAVDLEASWTSIEAVLPMMLEARRGAIINIASTHGFQIIPHTFPYPVAKHGLIGMTKAIGIEYAAQGLRCNAIAPAYIDTQIARDYWAGFDDPVAERRKAEALHPPGRIGRPEEVAMTAVFLASDEAPFINAETIMIDGGRSALFHGDGL